MTRGPAADVEVEGVDQLSLLGVLVEHASVVDVVLSELSNSTGAVDHRQSPVPWSFPHRVLDVL